MAHQTGRTTGFWLSIPNLLNGAEPVITRLPDATTMDEAREDAIEAGHIAFTEAGYETMDTVYATLYQIAPNGGLAHSECFTIDGPEAQ